jgi:putative PIN family toxin of toxin-antitoxin system
VVLDTNTIISSLLWSGAPRLVLQLIEQEDITPCISLVLIAELQAVLQRPKFEARLALVAETSTESVNGYLQYADVIDVLTPPERVVANDPDDDRVVACAVAAAVDYIISGDRHLLDLGRYENIPILNAADFLTAYAESLAP